MQERDVLFGVLSTQLGFLTPQQVLEASASAEAGLPASPAVTASGSVDIRADIRARPSKLAATVQSRGHMSGDQCALVEMLMQSALSAHHGDYRRTLASFGGEARVAQSFGVAYATTASGEIQQGSSNSDPDADLMAITQEHLGRYRWPDDGAELGRGGIGRVLVARDLHLRRDVAVKELLPDQQVSLTQTPRGSVSPQTVRFLREARVTGQLEHPNIVPVYELGARKDGSLYYTMKIVRGRTLSDKLGECRSLAERLRLLPHFIDACQALAYAHNRGVVHRDIKPDNIMIGEFGETVVLDWGLAKVSGIRDLREDELHRDAQVLAGVRAPQGPAEAPGVTAPGTRRARRAVDGSADDSAFDDLAQTRAGELLGTPLYMSPEQARGRVDEMGPTTDVWSLGVVLYEMLTGEVPFAGTSLYEVAFKISSGEYRPVNECVPDAPRELAAVVDKALRVDKRARYQDARELAQELSAYLTGGRVGAYDYRVGELLIRFARKHKAALAVLAIATIAVLALAVSSYLTIRAERDRAENARRQAEGLMTYLLGDMRDKLEDSGRLELLEDVVARVQSHYAAYPDDDPGSIHLRARAHDLTGAIYRMRGDVDGSMTDYRRAISMLQPLTADYPDRAEYLDSLAQVHLHMGQAHSARADLQAAGSAYEAARTAEETLAARDPDNLDWRLDRSKVYAALGHLADDRGDLSAAAEAHKQALDVRRSLVEAAPDRGQFQAYVAASYEAIGDVGVARGELPVAEVAYGEALAIRDELDSRDPGNAEWKQSLSALHARLGELHVKRRDWAKAEAAYRESLELSEWLVAFEPGNLPWQRDLANRHQQLGEIALDTGRLRRASASFATGKAILERLTERDPKNLTWQRELVVAHDQIADVQRARKAYADAEATAERAVDMLRTLNERAPDNAEWRRDTAIAYNQLGDIRAQREDRAGALAAYREALAISVALAERDPENASWQRDVAASHNRLGDAHARQGDNEAARTAYSAAADVLVALLKRDANNPEWRADLTLINERLRTTGGQPRSAPMGQSHDLQPSSRGAAMDQDHAPEPAKADGAAMDQDHAPEPEAAASGAMDMPPEPEPPVAAPMNQRHKSKRKRSKKKIRQRHRKKKKSSGDIDLEANPFM